MNNYLKNNFIARLVRLIFTTIVTKIAVIEGCHTFETAYVPALVRWIVSRAFSPLPLARNCQEKCTESRCTNE